MKPRKSTIKNDPFDAVIPLYPNAEVLSENREESVNAGESPVAAPTPQPRAKAIERPIAKPDPIQGRQKLTVHLDADLVNRVKNAAYWNPRLTIAKIAERGIRLALREVEKEHGEPYPQREADLVGGRPIK